MYKIINSLAPDYICRYMLPLASERTNYKFQTVNDITVMKMKNRALL